MKIIEGLKLIKELTEKASDLRAKIALHSAHLSIETPVYPDQKRQVSEWLQAHEDIVRQIAKLHTDVAKTNLATLVAIRIGDRMVTHSITEWIMRRRTLAALDQQAWASLTDRGLKEQNFMPAPGSPVTQVRILRCYDPVERDNKVTLYKSEPGIIDRSLEVANATTDLLD